MTFPRQPEKLVITPSNQSPWIGFLDAPGARFTMAQAYAMMQRGLDPETVETITVYREATTREMYWGIGQAPPVFQFDCPVLERRKDGKVKVVAPSGEGKFVLASGWVREPSRRNRHLLTAQAEPGDTSAGLVADGPAGPEFLHEPDYQRLGLAGRDDAEARN